MTMPDKQQTAMALEDLLELMARLRGPDGCPWDKAQSFESIVPHTLEEAYEVAETIEQQQWQALPGELGDLLFQVVFYCQLGAEQGQFNFASVATQLVTKLKQRHPHIYGDSRLTTPDSRNAEQALSQWEALKTQEREKRQQYSLMDDIPLALPALTRANKIQKRAASVGFDWQILAPVVAKVHEEIEEVMAEVEQTEVDSQRVLDEMGDLLFATVNLARHLKVNPEQALRHANRKFSERFRSVETQVAQSQRGFDEHSLDELEAYWVRAKQE
ncbi:nucleoside triphosphate pyrophosphohydrolase [Paraferrimonas haliotis]|uniref:Nucleoside triphosphate pyrophosphohydrolase n=1 Tax=Paraferrimonas haliotis TaxID=2013866 RepID=A0AA37TQM7_9GAMM|nr:nucleoside triphosphate pyrophosphohydrolase [Paraferrimonas haliotis]GLS82831.1 nucleoside triphosphate pyrophosphohydrolase [Paraferrimonas haliotis]